MVAIKRSLVFLARAMLWLSGSTYTIECTHEGRGWSWSAKFVRPARADRGHPLPREH